MVVLACERADLRAPAMRELAGQAVWELRILARFKRTMPFSCEERVSDFRHCRLHEAISCRQLLESDVTSPSSGWICELVSWHFDADSSDPLKGVVFKMRPSCRGRALLGRHGISLPTFNA